MKKIIIIIILLILITGCTKETQPVITEFYPIYNEMDIKLNLMYSTLYATLGEYNNVRTEESNYDSSEAKVYEYDTLEIETYNDNGIEKIYSITFTSPDQETKEGIKIGNTKEDMLNIYKDNYKNPIDNIYIYNISNTNISFTLENDIIVGIRYYLS